MSLQEKYKSVLAAGHGSLSNFAVKEEGGKLKVSGNAKFGLHKDDFWDVIKANAGWEAEVEANIKVDDTSVYGTYTVKSGDSLSKIAKSTLKDGNRYMDIFNLNKDILKNPDAIQPGQVLKLPSRA